MKVVMPSDPYTAKGLMKAAIRDDNPVLYIEPLSLYTVKGEIPTDDYIQPIGETRTIQEGTDVTVVSVGRMLGEARKALPKLEEAGISVELLDLCTVNPLPMEDIYNSVKKTNRLVIMHEAKETMGIGAEIAAAVQEQLFDYLDAPVARVAAPFTHIAFQPLLEKEYLPDAGKLVDKVKALIG
jgi:pyruvate/2-oxoglutarate/acetoin dehydrogenase E1 component